MMDIAETQLHETSEQVHNLQNPETNTPQTALPLQAMIMIAIIIATILKLIGTYIQEIPEITKKTAQAVKSTTTKIGPNKPF